MDEKTIELIVEQEDAGMRLDAYLREKTPFSRSRIVSLDGGRRVDCRWCSGNQGCQQNRNSE